MTLRPSCDYGIGRVALTIAENVATAEVTAPPMLSVVMQCRGLSWTRVRLGNYNDSDYM